MIGMLATAKAGHDKNNIYIVIAENEEYVFLADGNLRPINKTKKKNKKHIQIIKKNKYNEIKELIEKQQITNEIVKREIKLYCKSNE